MEDYKPNSNKSRDMKPSWQPRREPKYNEPIPEKKVEKVITGAATTKKKGEMQKFADVFISKDVSNVKSYILLEVLVPALKKAISDIVTNGIDMILYGESERTKKTSTASKVSYRGYYENNRDRRYADTPRARSGFDYDDIIFSSRGDAEAVISSMDNIIGNSVLSALEIYMIWPMFPQQTIP